MLRKNNARDLILGALISMSSLMFSQGAHAGSVWEEEWFWDSGKVYSIFGFEFCFPTCPYEIRQTRFTKHAFVERPMAR